MNLFNVLWSLSLWELNCYFVIFVNTKYMGLTCLTPSDNNKSAKHKADSKNLRCVRKILQFVD